MTIEEIKQLCSRIQMRLFGLEFNLRVERDSLRPIDGRLFIQITYVTPCNKTGIPQEWHGRKWYLSDYMTEDEVVKTAWCAFEAAVKHEVMECFLVEGKPLFNPHINYRELLEISDREVKRS